MCRGLRAGPRHEKGLPGDTVRPATGGPSAPAIVRPLAVRQACQKARGLAPDCRRVLRPLAPASENCPAATNSVDVQAGKLSPPTGKTRSMQTVRLPESGLSRRNLWEASRHGTMQAQMAGGPSTSRHGWPDLKLIVDQP